MMTMTPHAPSRYYLERYCLELAAVTVALPFGEIARMADTLLDCHRCGGTIFALGNGGSAATASHFACDLAKGARADGLPPFRVVPLTDNVPLITAWANDTNYAQVFAEQLAALVRPDDVVVAISASGNSPNVLAAARVARAAGALVVALSGRCGGKLRALADLTIRVPSDTIEQVEDAHIAIAHGLCVTLRTTLRAQTAARAAESRTAGADEQVGLPLWNGIGADGAGPTRVVESGRAFGGE
jgi:D-sedoheptulose 7-phosphate isomerase